ncbi:MAG: hypothetical protein ACNFW9_01540 [Candidatus Kerfeldbacteria bacterium]
MDYTRDYLKIYTKAAKKLDLKYTITNSYIYEIFYKSKSIRFYQATPDVNDSIAHAMTDRKNHTNLFLKSRDVPVFPHKGFYNEPNSDIIKFAKKIGFPVIIKPIKGYGGEGIIADIQNVSQLKNAIKKIKKYYKFILIEKFYSGYDHRILICKNKVLAVTKRFPAKITGDGKKTIKELIKLKNRKLPHPITIGQEVLHKLKAQQLTINSIPKDDEKIYLRDRANAHLGGTTYNLDIKTVHPDYIKACLKAMKELDMVFAGFDFMTTDITKSYKKTGGAITEVNDNPGIYMQSRSAENPINNIAEQVLINLFNIKR